MNFNQPITTTRDCEAIQIPNGNIINIPAGTDVRITQDLGGTFTVATHYGLARIDGKNADALGLEVPIQTTADDPESAEVSEEEVWERLRTCYDPEIPVNIVDLGLVYDCGISDTESGAKRVDVKMTLTAPGCGMGPTIAAEAESKILGIPGVKEADVQRVWDPPWNQSMISEAGKMKLGLI